MSDDDFELVRGSGNIYHDFEHPEANVRQTKAILAAQIIGILDQRELSTRAAETLTGVKYVEFSRIRNAHLKNFTIDRLITILGALDSTLEVTVSFAPWQQPTGDSEGAALKG